MLSQPLNIIEFIKHPKLLNDQTLSVAQQAILKTIYGLSLNDEESEIYRRTTGRSEVISAEQYETTLIAGRRSGKTSKIAAPIAIYEAFREHRISPAYGQKDDVAVTIALAASELARRPRRREPLVHVIQVPSPYQGALDRQRFVERGWIRIG